ncbi:DoxX-like family protein [Parachryseolinea silvisoli]|uniref:DoxX-like family protein n=1 Tax=Parachryseolinea silvisoli TaxID=2873601 RepID=UPI002265F541|nr:DoxX-like family protein [Parachryseolinea silvisoli]MCD9017167.1 DoxX-like family protein [Parachryseolinea silvisoli]
MIRSGILKSFSTTFICLVWLANGLLCKVLNLVPRHQEIVARILGEQYSEPFTKVIGISEIVLAVWIVSRIKSRFCAVFQMAIVGMMNIIEFIIAPDLLLFGRMNIMFASMFIMLIYVNEFILGKHKAIRNKQMI